MYSILDAATDPNPGEDIFQDDDRGDDPGETHEPDMAPDPVPDPAPDSIPDLIPDIEPDEAPSCERFVFNLEGCNRYEHSIDHIFAGSPDPIMHVIGIYESESGSMVLHIGRTYRPVVLVLGSHTATDWIIDRADGANIEQILLYGYEHHSVSGADDIPVTDMTGDLYVGSGYCWPFCSGGGYTQDMVQSAEELTGLTLSTFNGRYRASEIYMSHECREDCSFVPACSGWECGLNDECRVDCGSCPDDLACVEHACVACEPDCSGHACGSDGCDGTCGTCPDGSFCDEDGNCVGIDFFAGCEDVTMESHYCVTILANSVGLVGLDTGSVCPIGKEIDYLDVNSFSIESIAWLDGYLYVCGEGLGAHGLLRINPLDASWELAPVYCEAVAAYNGGLLTKDLGPFGLMFFPSFDHAMALDGEAIPGRYHASRMTVQGSTLYAAWHSTNEIDVFRLPSGTTAGTITLEDFDSWVYGLSVTSDDLLLLLSMSYDIIIFEESTGSRIDVVDELRAMKGLFCMTNP